MTRKKLARNVLILVALGHMQSCVNGTKGTERPGQECRCSGGGGSVDASYCNEVLKYATEITNESQLRQVFDSLDQTDAVTTSSQINRRMNVAGQATLVASGYPIPLGASFEKSKDKSEFNSRFNRILQLYKSLDQSTVHLVRTNSEVIQSWRACIASQRRGLILDTSAAAAPGNRLSLVVRLQDNMLPSVVTHIRYYDVDSNYVKNLELPKGGRLVTKGASFEFSIPRREDAPVFVDVTSDCYGKLVYAKFADGLNRSLGSSRRVDDGQTTLGNGSKSFELRLENGRSMPSGEPVTVMGVLAFKVSGIRGVSNTQPSFTTTLRCLDESGEAVGTPYMRAERSGVVLDQSSWSMGVSIQQLQTTTDGRLILEISVAASDGKDGVWSLDPDLTALEVYRNN